MDGITCPNCGAHELEGKFCAYCGSQLLREEPVKAFAPYTVRDSYTIPVGEYKGCNCNVVLEEDAIVIKQFVIGQSGNNANVRIPYNQISGIYYYRPEDKWITWGYIVIRWTENADMPLPDRNKINSLSNKQKNEHAIATFDGLDEQVFYQIFCFVRSMALSDATSGIYNPTASLVGKHTLAQSVDFDACFERYSPFRDRAISEVCKGLRINKKIAKVIVDEEFDHRQYVLYTNDPSVAVRDLNRVVRMAIVENKKYTVNV